MCLNPKKNDWTENLPQTDEEKDENRRTEKINSIAEQILDENMEAFLELAK